MTHEIGYIMSGHGFLRGYCRLCRPTEAVQVCSTASPDDNLHAAMQEHYRTVHDADIEICMGSVTRHAN